MSFEKPKRSNVPTKIAHLLFKVEVLGDVTAGPHNQIRKSGNIVQMVLVVSTKYNWDAGRGLYIGHVPGGFRPSTERAAPGITKNKVTFSYSVYNDGAINIWPNENLVPGDGIYLNTTWVI